MNKLQEIRAKFEVQPSVQSSIPNEIQLEFDINYLLRIIEELKKVVGEDAVNKIAESV